MTDVALTGGGGFLGFHTRAALLEHGTKARSMTVGDLYDPAKAAREISGAGRVIHLAGVNRASDTDVADGNRLFAGQLAESLRSASVPPRVVVYANSTQSTNGSVYGDAKAAAAETVASAAADIGAEFLDVQLPNLFGEHGKPFYNAVTSTFSHMLATGQTPTIDTDRTLSLLHAQDAAEVLLGTEIDVTSKERTESVSGLLRRLTVIATIYENGEIPDISDDFSRDLFNTYRSYAFPRLTPIGLTRRADTRGSFFEIVRSHGGPGQSSFSTTVPGVTRGDHFHRRKIERFTVLAGRGTIRLRRLFTDEVLSFEVDGQAPGAIDMPTMWTHSIENSSAETLYTSFWTNDIFDPQNPDTTAEAVLR